MIDGTTEVTDPHRTAENQALVRRFVDDILVDGRMEGLARLLRWRQAIPPRNEWKCHMNPAKRILLKP